MYPVRSQFWVRCEGIAVRLCRNGGLFVVSTWISSESQAHEHFDIVSVGLGPWLV